MYEAPGIGLAATQLGVMKRMFVMDCAGKDEPPQPMVLVNPEILWRSEETETSEEGCLSIPDVYEEVTRAGAGAACAGSGSTARRTSGSSATAGRSARSTRSTTSTGGCSSTT